MRMGMNIGNGGDGNALDHRSVFRARFNIFNHSVLIDGNANVLLPTGRREGRCEMELALDHASHYTVYTTLYK